MITTEPIVIVNGKYSVKQTAEKLQVSTRTVQRYIKSGLLKATTRKVNGKRYINGLEIIKVWNTTY